MPRGSRIASTTVAALILTLLWLRHDRTTRLQPQKRQQISDRIGSHYRTLANRPQLPAPVQLMSLIDLTPTGDLVVAGRVIGSDGSPVPAADVWISTVPPRYARTDRQGGFTFDRLAVGSYVLGASTDTAISAPTNIRVGAQSDHILLRILGGAQMLLRVVDEGRRPIVGADVLSLRSAIVAKTGLNGEVMLSPLAPGETVFRITAPRFAGTLTTAVVATPDTSLQKTVVLHHGIALGGRVIDEDGDGVSGAYVFAVPEGESQYDLAGEVAITDSNGHFRLQALAPGAQQIIAVDKNHAPARSQPIFVRDGAQEVILIMRNACVLRGVVRDEDGQPQLALLHLEDLNRRAWIARRVNTDIGGHFEIDALARGRYLVEAESPSGMSDRVLIECLDSGLLQQDFVLNPLQSISGSVVDEGGAPLPGVQVNAVAVTRPGFSSSASTDESGRFKITGLPAGNYWLGVERFSKEIPEPERTLTRAGTSNVRLLVKQPGIIRGRCVLSGEPALCSPFAVTLNGGLPVIVVSGREFLIDGLPPGVYNVALYGQQFADVERRVVVRPGAVTDMGDIAVPRGRTISGRVVDADGVPVVGARVWPSESTYGTALPTLPGDLDAWRQVDTDQSGEFSLFAVPDRDGIVLTADHPNFGRAVPISVPKGQQRITLTLLDCGMIQGRITINGQPAAGAIVTCEEPMIDVVETGSEGEFAMLRVPEGVWRLSVIIPESYVRRSSVVTVTSGLTTQVTIDLPADR